MPDPTKSAARLWLVRHGQTDWNLAGRIQGHTPTELNAAGLSQAEALASYFAGAQRKFAACYSSDLPRARQTADVIGSRLGLAPQLNADLRERSFGDYEGHTHDQIKTARESFGLDQTGDLADWTGFPGIESNDSLWLRISRVLKEISEKHPGEDVLVVTHGGVIARAVYVILNIREGASRRFALANGIVAIIQGRGEGFQLLSLADLTLLLSAESPVDTATVARK